GVGEGALLIRPPDYAAAGVRCSSPPPEPPPRAAGLVRWRRLGVPEDRAARPSGGRRPPGHALRPRSPERTAAPGRNPGGAREALPLSRLRALHRDLDHDHERAAASRRLPPHHRRLRRGGSAPWRPVRGG